MPIGFQPDSFPVTLEKYCCGGETATFRPSSTSGLKIYVMRSIHSEHFELIAACSHEFSPVLELRTSKNRNVRGMYFRVTKM